MWSWGFGFTIEFRETIAVLNGGFAVRRASCAVYVDDVAL